MITTYKLYHSTHKDRSWHRLKHHQSKARCHFFTTALSRLMHKYIKKKDGSWLEDSYIPAYIRRYPFIFSELPDSDQLTLCVDMHDDVIEENGDQPFFDKDGKPTDLANNALEFCKSYHAAAGQTVKFSKALVEANILVDREAELNVAGGKKIKFSGFQIIDEEKLSKLDDKTFLKLREDGWLPYIYAHLFSGAQWSRMTRLLNDRM